MFVEDITTTRDRQHYKAQNEWIKRFLDSKETKLFLTIRNKKALSQHPKFPVPKNYEHRVTIVRKTMRLLRKDLNLRSKDFWFFAIHEKGQSSDLSNSAHCHVIVNYRKEIDEKDLADALKSWDSYSSKKFGLDICYRKHGKSNGSIFIESQHRVAEYVSKIETFHKTSDGYRPFWKRPFHSENLEKWQDKRDTDQEEVLVAKAIEKPITSGVIEPIEEEIEEVKEPIVSKKNQSGVLNFKSAVLILGFAGVLGYLIKRKSGD